MKHIKNMSPVELAACVQDSLRAEGIRVVLSGESAVSFYSSNKYVSKDLDLINTSISRRSKIKAVMDRHVVLFKVGTFSIINWALLNL